MQYSIGRNQQAVQGIPLGRLNNLESRVSSLEDSSTTTTVNNNREIMLGSVSTFSTFNRPIFITINGVMYFEYDNVLGEGNYIVETSVQETPSGLINSINTTFTVTAIPKFIVLNGVIYYEDNGYTRSDLTITLSIAPMTGSTLRSISNYKITLNNGLTATSDSTLISYYGTDLTVERPSGTIDGVNNSFTVVNIPDFINLNGISYFENDGYTISGLTLTLSIIPPVGSILRSIY